MKNEHDDGPGEIPRCAGRVAVAHERTEMSRVRRGWVCSVCGETDADWPTRWQEFRAAWSIYRREKVRHAWFHALAFALSGPPTERS